VVQLSKMVTKILNLIPTMQSLALASDNYNFVKKKKKSFVKQGVKNIVGIEIMKETANLIYF